jgi:hypothetical protein
VATDPTSLLTPGELDGDLFAAFRDARVFGRWFVEPCRY